MANTMTACSKIRLSLKCIQLILSCVCIGLFANSYIGDMTKSVSILSAVTFGGYIIILIGMIAGFACEERVPKKVDLLYTLAGLALFVAAGSVFIAHTQAQKTPYLDSKHMGYMKKTVNIGLATGSIAIINGGVFLIDAVLSYRDVTDYTPHQ